MVCCFSRVYFVFHLVQATKIMVGSPFKASRIELLDIDHVCVKVPMFSFTRLQGADPVLRVEMASTGEVACFSSRPLEAFLKGLLATGAFRLPNKQKSILLSLGPQASKMEFLPSAQLLVELGYKLYGTEGTAEFFERHGVAVTMLTKPEQMRRAATKRRSSVGGSTVDAESAVASAQAMHEAATSKASGASKMHEQSAHSTSPALRPMGTNGEGAEQKQLLNILDVSSNGAQHEWSCWRLVHCAHVSPLRVCVCCVCRFSRLV